MDKNQTVSEPWYKDGLRFKCSGCGDCCTGTTGFVWVNQAEINALAKQLDLTVEEFEANYTRHVGIRRSLIEFSNGDCVLFDNKTRKCKTYENRPRQCRTWPFWKSNLKTPQAWKEVCEVCPGSGTGKLYHLEAIEEQKSQITI